MKTRWIIRLTRKRVNAAYRNLMYGSSGKGLSKEFEKKWLKEK